MYYTKNDNLVKIIQFIKYAIVHQCFFMTLSCKIIVRKPTLQTIRQFFLKYLPNAKHVSTSYARTQKSDLTVHYYGFNDMQSKRKLNY